MNWLKRFFCAHRYEWMRNIYGDEINLSGGKRVLLLRNHGPVVIGHTLPQAFSLLWLVQRACEIQVASAPLGKLRQIPVPVLESCVRDSLNFNPKFGAGEDAFAAMQRLIDRIDPGYRA
jgi:ribulose-5-phosphate 4-epimerase/fuculose-1-phosphate aldolase